MYDYIIQGIIKYFFNYLFINKNMKFIDGLKYPFIRPKGLTNFFWILVPILGIFVFLGYFVDVVNSIVSGNSQSGAPIFRGFGESLKEGIMFFIRTIPFVFILTTILFGVGMFSESLTTSINILVSLIYTPMMSINLAVKKDISATFEIRNILEMVFKNIGKYSSTLVKWYAYGFIALILSLVLIGLPMMLFGAIYLADFYREVNSVPVVQNN